MEKVMILATPSEIAEGLEKFLEKYAKKQPEPDFESERLNRTKAAQLAGVSIPTFAKMITNKVFPEHGFGRKKFYLKSEVIDGLKTVANDKI